MTETDWFPDDASNRLVEFISVVWPKEHLEENLTFIADQVEVSEADVIAIVREFARLSGQSDRVRAVQVKGIDGDAIVPARGGEFPPATPSWSSGRAPAGAW